MSNTHAVHAGDSIVKTLTFTVAAGEAASRVTLILTRSEAQSANPTIGRARCIVLDTGDMSTSAAASAQSSGTAVVLPRARFQVELRGVVPASICGGSYRPVFCTFAYVDGQPTTGFEIDADQRFAIEVADDAASVDAGPSIIGFA